MIHKSYTASTELILVWIGYQLKSFSNLLTISIMSNVNIEKWQFLLPHPLPPWTLDLLCRSWGGLCLPLPDLGAGDGVRTSTAGWGDHLTLRLSRIYLGHFHLLNDRVHSTGSGFGRLYFGFLGGVWWRCTLLLLSCRGVNTARVGI